MGSRLEHAFTIRDVRNGSPILRCSNGGCPVVWWPDRNKPAGGCRGRKPLQWDHGPYGSYPACGGCIEWLSRPGMAEAIASVGIERGGVDVRRMVEYYHREGHREV